MSPEFIVESILPGDNSWKFIEDTQYLGIKKIQTPNSGIPKKFTSLATNATIFRWRFGDEPGNPITETTVNPYIHTYAYPGNYDVSHQSCYPCVATGTLTCSNGWCTKSVNVQKEEAFAGLAIAGALFFIFIKPDKCNNNKITDKCLTDKDCTWQEGKCFTRQKKNKEINSRKKH